jgi:nucleotide-binding universal stress UspA family protein
MALEEIPVTAVAKLSRSADLIVAGGSPYKGQDRHRWCDPAELILLSGRPVLLAPPSGGTLAAEAVIVAWRDTREARRALADALPFMQGAREVVVMEVCAEDQFGDAESRTFAVVQGLKRHGVEARAKVVIGSPDQIAAELDIAAGVAGADLIVAGGYGHSRLGEWVFGGVTRDLLQGPERFLLMSH